MTVLDIFLWSVFPYIALTIFVLGHIYRYNHDQFGWSAQSSEFISKDNYLKWGSRMFHWGIIFVFFGHVAGILVPKAFYHLIGVTDHMYHFVAAWIGGLAGLVTVIGGALLAYRRLTNKRVARSGNKMNLYILLILGVVVIVGFTNTVGYTASGGDFDYRDAVSPWFRGILTFRPMPELMMYTPIGFRLHVLAAHVLFAFWPFTRLVHVWSLPLEYINRKYVVFRRVTPRKALAKIERD